MTPFIASHSTCVCRKASRVPAPGKLACFLLGLFVAVPVFAAGVDLAPEEMYSDDVTVTTFNGDPLDINGDGFVDVAVASNSSENALRSRYYPGLGDGTFGAPVLLTTGPSSEIVAADFNGDGFIDLVQGIRDRTSHLYLGAPPAELDPATHIDILDQDRVLAVAVGDLDNDGDLDLVTATGHPGGEPSTPDNLAPNRFYLNNTIQGTTPLFGVPGTDIAPDADDTRSIALADMDGDGLLDVIAGNDETTAGSNRIYLNQSTSAHVVSFAAGFDFGPADDQTGKILVGDLNGDGLPDIVVLNFVATGSPGINRFFLNQSTVGNLAFSQADISADTNSSSGGTLGDFDGDGDLDVAVANVFGGTTAINRLYLNQFVESGAVTFVGSDIFADEHQTRELAAGDIDGDSDLDLIAGNQPLPGDADTAAVAGRDRVYLNNGSAAPFTDSEVPSFTSTPVTEATADTAYTYAVTATDPEGDTLAITASVLPAWLALTDNGDGTATLAGTPAATDVGDHAVTLEVSDGINTTPQDFTIAVAEAPTGGNTAPTFTSTAVTAATEAVVYTYAVTTSDADGDALTITATTLPAWLTFTDNGDGTATLTGTPAAADVGDHAVTLEVFDGTDIAAQGFTITVAAAPSGGNVAPEITSTAVTSATESEAYTYAVTTADADGDALTITAPTLPAWLTLADNGDGTATLSGTPAAGDVGDHAVSLQVSDGTDTAVQDFTVSVEAAAAPPSPPDNGGGDGGGGGSFGALFLLVLAGLGTALRRRRSAW